MNVSTAVHEELVTPSQVARVLQVDERTVSTWTKQGLIPSYKVARTTRYRMSEVLAAIRLGMQQPREEGGNE